MGYDADPVMTHPPARHVARRDQVVVVEAAEESRDPVEGRFSPVAHPACVPEGIQGVGVIGGDLTTTSPCSRPILTK